MFSHDKTCYMCYDNMLQSEINCNNKKCTENCHYMCMMKWLSLKILNDQTSTIKQCLVEIKCQICNSQFDALSKQIMSQGYNKKTSKFWSKFNFFNNRSIRIIDVEESDDGSSEMCTIMILLMIFFFLFHVFLTHNF